MPHIFAKIEVNFPQDARMKILTPQERWVYICIWCHAVGTRTECLLPETSTVTYLSYLSNTHHNTVVSTIKKASNMEVPLLKRESNGGLTVYGVTKHHRKLFSAGTDRVREEKRREDKIREDGTTLANAETIKPNKNKSADESWKDDIRNIWRIQSGRDIKIDEEEVCLELEKVHGYEVVRDAMIKARGRRKVDSLAYVRVICQNNPESRATGLNGPLGKLLGGLMVRLSGKKKENLKLGPHGELLTHWHQLIRVNLSEKEEQKVWRLMSLFSYGIEDGTIRKAMTQAENDGELSLEYVYKLLLENYKERGYEIKERSLIPEGEGQVEADL